MARAFMFAVPVCMLLAMPIGRIEAEDGMSAPPFPGAAESLPATDPASLPLTRSVWVSEGEKWREVVPGTSEYYNLRIRARCHLESSRLVPSLLIDGEVRQVLPGPTLLVQEVYPARCDEGNSSYAGYARKAYFTVSVPSTNGFTVGAIRKFQLRADAPDLSAVLADGRVVKVTGCTLVSSPTLDEYVSFFKAQPQQEGNPVIGIGSDSTPSPGKGMLHPETPPAQNAAHPSVKHPVPDILPTDPVLLDSRKRDLERQQADIEDRVRRRDKVIESVEMAREKTTDPEARAALDDVLRRARERSSSLAERALAVSNEAARVDKALNENKAP